MDINKNANLSMLCDYYELTMGNGYFVQGMQDRITYFDIFFRSVPDNGGFAIAAGLEQAIEYVQQLHFDEDDIAYLRSRKMFDEGFLQYLRGFRFTGDIWAVPEGTPIFPREPIMTVRAPAIQAQLVETFLLLTLNHQSLIADAFELAAGKSISTLTLLEAPEFGNTDCIVMVTAYRDGKQIGTLNTELTLHTAYLWPKEVQ